MQLVDFRRQLHYRGVFIFFLIWRLAVKALVPLVDVIGIYIRDLAVRERKTRLDLQRPFQLLWQRFAPFKRPAQYPHASLR